MEICTEVVGDGDVREGLLRMLVPMSDIPKWEYRPSFAKEETRMLMES